MSTNRKLEARSLDKGELELVTRTYHPELQQVADDELSSLIKLIRERRDRAKTETQRRKREMRGKADPKGASASRSAEGNKAKLDALAAAVRRLNAERTRREQMASRMSQVDLAKAALKLKQEGVSDESKPFNTRTAHQGMRKVASQRREDLVRPMELGRLRKAASVAQAKRDNP